MPARSKAQQKAAGAALAAKRGDMPASKLKGASRGMYDSMSEEQLEEFAATRRKGLPKTVSSMAGSGSTAKTTAAKEKRSERSKPAQSVAKKKSKAGQG